MDLPPADHYDAIRAGTRDAVETWLAGDTAPRLIRQAMETAIEAWLAGDTAPLVLRQAIEHAVADYLGTHPDALRR